MPHKNSTLTPAANLARPQRQARRYLTALIAIFGAACSAIAASTTFFNAGPLTNSYASNGSVLVQVTEAANSPLARLQLGSLERNVLSNTAQIIFPESFGAAADGTILTTVTATSGSPTVTCGAAAWTSADVGKAVCLYLDTTNMTYLLTTIQAVNSATSINLAANSTKTWSGNGRLIYGTDNTAAIQSAMNAAYNLNGAIIQFRAGTYVVAGTPHTNSQSLFRDVSVLTPVAPVTSGTGPMYWLTLQGVTSKGTEYSVQAGPSSFGGTVLFCPSRQPVDSSYTNFCSVISQNASGAPWNNLNLRLRFLTFKTPVNPQISILNNSVGGGTLVEQCTFDIDFPAGFLAVAQDWQYVPTGQIGVGASVQAARAITLPGSFNTAECVVRETYIAGYGTGIQIGGVHAQLYNVGIHGCNEAIILGNTNIGSIVGGLVGGFRIHPLACRYDTCCLPPTTVAQIDWHSYTPEGYTAPGCNPTNVSQWLDPGNQISGSLTYEPEAGRPITTFGNTLNVLDGSTGLSWGPGANYVTVQATNFVAKGGANEANRLRLYGGAGADGTDFCGGDNGWMKIKSIFYGSTLWMLTNWSSTDWAWQPATAGLGMELGSRVGGTGMQLRGVYSTNFNGATVTLGGLGDGNNYINLYGGTANNQGLKLIGLNNDWAKFQTEFYGVNVLVLSNWSTTDWVWEPASSGVSVDLGSRSGGTGMQWRDVWATNYNGATLKLGGLGDGNNYINLYGGTANNQGVQLIGLNNNWFRIKDIFYGTTPLMLTNASSLDWSWIPDNAYSAGVAVDLGRAITTGPTWRATYQTNLTTYNANKSALISSNVTVSPYLWTNPFTFNVVVYVSGAGGGSNSIAQNGSFIGYMTNGATLLCQPGEYVWVTNGAANPKFSIKPF